MESREKLSNLSIQEMWLSHRVTNETVNSRAHLGRHIFDDGEKVELLFPFSEKNGELTHIAYGVDYEVQRNKPIGATLVEIGIDGTYSVLTEVPIKILSLDNAVARVGDESVQILNALDDSSRKAIAFDPAIDRFARTSDLKNRTIELFRAEAVYPRWVEIKEKEVKFSVDKAKRKIEEAELESIHLNLNMVRDGKLLFRQYVANVKYIDPIDRRHVIQPSDARRITLYDLSLWRELVLNANS